MPKAVADVVKSTIRSKTGWEKLKVTHTTIIESPRWRTCAESAEVKA